ncbi:MAG: YraN family protein [Halieaceae bacterium]|nr:YraN family protein [Halieaceae bacterium]
MHRGSAYENQAAAWLEAQGLTVETRNYRCRVGEIDLVCRSSGVLVFVEVRYRSNPRFASAVASITHAKQRRLIAAASHYLQRHHHGRQLPCRFDVVAIDHDPALGEDKIQWLKNAIGS